jgi:hypothetical protein
MYKGYFHKISHNRYHCLGCGSPSEYLTFSDTFSRVQRKAERLDQILRRGGKQAHVEEAFVSTLTPTLDSIKTNTETALKIESVLDIALDKIGEIKTN